MMEKERVEAHVAIVRTMDDGKVLIEYLPHAFGSLGGTMHIRTAEEMIMALRSGNTPLRMGTQPPEAEVLLYQGRRYVAMPDDGDQPIPSDRA